MPIYEYELCDGNCAACGGQFTLRRPITAPELTACPACRKPVRKVISGFSTPHHLKPLSTTDAKKAGFSVFKRVNKGSMSASDLAHGIDLQKILWDCWSLS